MVWYNNFEFIKLCIYPKDNPPLYFTKYWRNTILQQMQWPLNKSNIKTYIHQQMYKWKLSFLKYNKYWISLWKKRVIIAILIMFNRDNCVSIFTRKCHLNFWQYFYKNPRLSDIVQLLFSVFIDIDFEVTLCMISLLREQYIMIFPSMTRSLMTHLYGVLFMIQK